MEMMRGGVRGSIVDFILPGGGGGDREGAFFHSIDDPVLGGV
jgi:hypothetical protein